MIISNWVERKLEENLQKGRQARQANAAKILKEAFKLGFEEGRAFERGFQQGRAYERERIEDAANGKVHEAPPRESEC